MQQPDFIPNDTKQNKFSIIIPTCGRKNIVQRAIGSVLNQFYQNFELIVVDDGSEDGTPEVLRAIAATDDRVKVVLQPQRMQRCVTRNSGYAVATGDWICNLDSDDEYLRTYLSSLNHFINENPDYKCFHFGALVCKLGRYFVRDVPGLKEENEFGEAMERFHSGMIGMGSFAYSKEVMDYVGMLPAVGSPYKFADAAKDEFPEMMEWHGPKYMEGGKEIGNPWGEDYYLFYKITRKFKSKAVPMITYINYIRRSGFLDQDDDTILNRKRIYIA